MQFGPAGSSSAFAGGLGIRDEIYSWPTVNYCAVDQVTVDGDFDAGDFFQSSLVNVYGLDALELLLFRTEAENACSSRIDINRNGTWDDLVGAGQLVRRQADYAVVLADGILSQAQRLRDAWEPSGGNFSADLRNAGQGSSVYGSAKEAIDEVFAAFFVVDTKVKDLKLAIPAGISPDCPSEVCPEDVELPYSLSSKAALVANLDGLSAVFSGTGANNGGFVWYLQDVGASELAIRMSSQLDKTHDALEAIDGSLSAALMEDPATVILAYTEIQLFTTDMKSEFVSVLNLAVPQEGAGDND
jgi:predicted lipoprotein